MNWLRNFMTGRYGSDQLSLVLLVLSIIITVIASISGIGILSYLSYVPLAFVIFRMLSRNIAKRSMENYKFSMLVSPVYAWFRRTKTRSLEAKTHKFVKCPKCSTKLRLPKGKGKIIVTCPKCGNEFTIKT